MKRNILPMMIIAAAPFIVIAAEGQDVIDTTVYETYAHAWKPVAPGVIRLNDGPYTVTHDDDGYWVRVNGAVEDGPFEMLFYAQTLAERRAAELGDQGYELMRRK